MADLAFGMIPHLEQAPRPNDSDDLSRDRLGQRDAAQLGKLAQLMQPIGHRSVAIQNRIRSRQGSILACLCDSAAGNNRAERDVRPAVIT